MDPQGVILYFQAKYSELAALVLRPPQQWDEAFIHDVRVRCRQLSTFSWILKTGRKKVGKNSYQMATRKIIKELAEDFGEWRNLDVSILLAKENLLSPNLIKNLEQQRKQVKYRVKNLWSLKRRQQLAKLLLVEGKNLRMSLMTLQKARQHLRKRLGAITKTPPQNKKELHRDRIFFKKVRYFSESMLHPTKELKIIQNSLGEIHDLEILRDLIPREKKSLRRCENKKIERLQKSWSTNVKKVSKAL